jgi:hypothetical protein
MNKNIEKSRAQIKIWFRNHPEYLKNWLASHPGYHRGWKDKNKVSYLQYQKEWHDKNQDQIRDYMKIYMRYYRYLRGKNYQRNRKRLEINIIK